uniref:Natural cytotoxicity triggering receptor 3 n=1 Tax=Xenopus tropicalis TaxID=8364 RepID=A0A6I8PTQ8_XENTR
MRGTGLLLLLCALQGCLLQNIRVSQIPAVSATEGSTVTLQCHYTLSSTENGSLGWYRWYRHVLGGPEVSNNSRNYTGRVSSACQSDCPSEFINNRSASIQLHRVQISDTGMYICEVTLELSRTLQGHGNGTFLNVTADVTANSSGSNDYLYYIIGAVILVFLICVAVYIKNTKYVSAFPREEEPCPYTDFTAQASRIHVNTPAERQIQTNEEHGVTIENAHYAYNEPEIIRNRPLRQSCQHVYVYSEIP